MGVSSATIELIIGGKSAKYLVFNRVDPRHCVRLTCCNSSALRSRRIGHVESKQPGKPRSEHNYGELCQSSFVKGIGRSQKNYNRNR